MKERVGRALELFFIDGKADGMLTAKVFNWTGLVLMTPRTQIAEALMRPEAGYTGVYLLLGEQEGQDLAYIGEGEDISKRIRNHDAKKDWWTSAVLMTAAGNNLHKGHAQYLEARLVEKARAVQRIPLENSVDPQRPTLSEADTANMELFLDYLEMVLPALRIDMFLDRSESSANRRDMMQDKDAPRFELNKPGRNARATATLVDGEFIVDEGAEVNPVWDSPKSGYKRLYDELHLSGVIRKDLDRAFFARSYAFRSPSAAAAVVLGRSANGRTNWKLVGSAKSYADWEEERLAQPSHETLLGKKDNV